MVIERLNSDAYPGAVYHYVNTLLRHSGHSYPLWLRVGIGELFSNLKPVAGKVQVGARQEHHIRTLTSEKPLDLETLTSVTQDSPIYQDRDRARLFYAQSWALTHMLQLSEQYRQQYPEFLHVLLGGGGAAAALEEAYGKPLRRVQQELDGYVRSDWFRVAYFDTRLEKSSENPEVRPVSSVEAGLVLLGLLRDPEKKPQAEQLLAELVKEHPGNWEIAEAQAYFELQHNNPQVAQGHFQNAIANGDTNPRAYYDYARLLQSSGSDDTAVLPLLEKAVALRPDFREARHTLAVLLYNQRRYDQAVEQIQAMGTLRREEAFELYLILGYSYIGLGERDEARKAAEQASLAGRTPQQMAEADELLSRLPQPSREPASQPAAAALAAEDAPPGDAPPEPEPPRSEDARPRLARRAAPVSSYVERPAPKPALARIEGTLSQFDCLGQVARLTILFSGRRASFAILEPTTVKITGAKSGTLDFSCGRQRPLPVAIEFEEKLDGQLGTTGVVRSIEFR